MTKKPVVKNAKPTSKSTAQYGGRKRAAAKLSVVLARPSSASAAGRKAQRVFVAGVERALGEARTRKIAVTVQASDGRLVRGVPARKGGAFIIAGGRDSARDKIGTTGRRAPGKGKRVG